MVSETEFMLRAWGNLFYSELCVCVFVVLFGIKGIMNVSHFLMAKQQIHIMNTHHTWCAYI